MRVRPINRCAGVIAYVLAIGGTGLLTLKLSSVLATQAIALTQPYFLDNCPCLPSLIEQRRMAAEFAVPPMVDGAKERVAALEAPSISVDVLAAQIIRAVAASARPAVLVAHSLGVHAVAHADEKLPRGAVTGAFLVAAPDLDNPEDFPAELNGAWPAGGFGFRPVPMQRLNFPSALLASADDPFCRLERAREFAAAWVSDLIEIGPAGHINAASGHGPWPDGVLRFGTFLKQLG